MRGVFPLDDFHGTDDEKMAAALGAVRDDHAATVAALGYDPLHSEPYVYTDPDGDLLHVSSAGEWLRLDIEDRGSTAAVTTEAVFIAAADVRKVTAAMHEKAGLPDRWAALKDIIFCLRPDGMSGEAYRRYVAESMGRLEAGQ